MSETTTVVIADNHALVLEGLCSLFSAEEDIRVVETVTDGRQLIEAVRRHQPNVVITDIKMDYQDGLSCLATIREISSATHVLILTAYTDGETLQAVLQSGADGLLLKTDPPEQASHAVRQVMAGQLVFPAAVRRWLGRMPDSQPEISLSERETEVLQLVAQGLTNAEVASRLQVSANTVKFHLQNIYQQLGVSNRTEASRWYLENRG